MFKCIRRLVILGLVFFAGFQIHDTYVNVHNVLQYKTMVKEILATNDTTANVDLVLAMIYTETKGSDGDVMQSSESTSGVANSITDSQTSIRQGVTLLSKNLTLAEEKAWMFGRQCKPTILERLILIMLLIMVVRVPLH